MKEDSKASLPPTVEQDKTHFTTQTQLKAWESFLPKHG